MTESTPYMPTDWVVYVIQSLEARVEEMSVQLGTQAREAATLESDMRALALELAPLQAIPAELARLVDGLDTLNRNHETFIDRIRNLESCESDFRHYCNENYDNQRAVQVTREMVGSTRRVVQGVMWLAGSLLTVAAFVQLILPYLRSAS